MKAIFDLDGTIALCEHRRHLAKEHWPSFERSCVMDQPNEPVIDVLEALHKQGWRIDVWSGRSEKVLGYTLDWLKQYEIFQYVYDLRMRLEYDQRRDDIMKESWLKEMPREQWPTIVFDDRQQVVDMWRANGIVCCQVAPGDF